MRGKLQLQMHVPKKNDDDGELYERTIHTSRKLRYDDRICKNKKSETSIYRLIKESGSKKV